jgi:hypothetical protein
MKHPPWIDQSPSPGVVTNLDGFGKYIRDLASWIADGRCDEVDRWADLREGEIPVQCFAR